MVTDHPLAFLDEGMIQGFKVDLRTPRKQVPFVDGKIFVK